MTTTKFAFSFFMEKTFFKERGIWQGIIPFPIEKVSLPLH